MASTMIKTTENLISPDFKFPTTTSKKDPHRMMLSMEWHGKENIRVVQRPKPMITDPTDAIIRVTSSTICGSDLHLYHGETNTLAPGSLCPGDVLGHEFMGIVESVGPEVTQIKTGDRVVVSFPITCGKCNFCKSNMPTLCDATNPSSVMETMYGGRLAGIFGYSRLTGGYEGGQAEYARVPFADNSCLKVPSHLSDEQVLFLSDIACTGWHANELGEVSEGQTVAVWGAGPVGLMAAMWAKFRGASKVVVIDGVDYRLALAKEKLGCEIINFKEVEVIDTLRKLFPGGPDVCIDAVGFRFPKMMSHKIQRSIGIESDDPEVILEAILAVKKGGKVSIVGDYFGYANGFPIGAMMEKGLTVRGGQAFVQKYWKQLLSFIEEGRVDMTWMISHVMPLSEIDKAYRMFDKKEDKALKIILKTGTSSLPTYTPK